MGSRVAKQQKLTSASSIEMRMVNAMRERGAAGKSSIKAFNSIIMKFPKIDATFEKVRVTFRRFGMSALDTRLLFPVFRLLQKSLAREGTTGEGCRGCYYVFILKVMSVT